MARLLVIDDIQEISTLICTILKPEGHDIVTCCDGEEGLKELNNKHYDLLISDIIMPNKDGLELLKHIRVTMQGSKQSIPIIAISGGGYTISLQTALFAARLYADIVLKKPFTAQDLKRSVSLLLAKRGAEDGQNSCYR